MVETHLTLSPSSPPLLPPPHPLLHCLLSHISLSLSSHELNRTALSALPHTLVKVDAGVCLSHQNTDETHRRTNKPQTANRQVSGFTADTLRIHPLHGFSPLSSLSFLFPVIRAALTFGAALPFPSLPPPLSLHTWPSSIYCEKDISGRIKNERDNVFLGGNNGESPSAALC